MFFEKNISKNQFLYQKKYVSVSIKREDLLHPVISGNKFRKLKYNIFEAKKQIQDTLLTFGGAYSNHIAATAYAGKYFGFKTIGVIRGDELGKNISKTLQTNPTLKYASENGMKFKFVSRSDYRNKTEQYFIENLKKELGDFYLIPEGGTNNLAVKGCEEILNKQDTEFDYICVASGTGGTISGIINSSNKNQIILGFPALKGEFLDAEIQPYIKNKNYKWITDFHFGGFAKINNELIRFINDFYKKFNVPIEPIYTAKMFYGIEKLIDSGYFKPKTKILAIHTGGLQGITAMNTRLKKNKKQLLVI
jgi:1-aminocyclopropane-1-carboxylate deaminase